MNYTHWPKGLMAFALLAVLIGTAAAEDSIDFSADPMLQDLLSKRAARKQQQADSNSAKTEKKTEKQSDKKPTLRSAKKQRHKAKPLPKPAEPSKSIGQNLIQLESKSARKAREKQLEEALAAEKAVSKISAQNKQGGINSTAPTMATSTTATSTTVDATSAKSSPITSAPTKPVSPSKPKQPAPYEDDQFRQAMELINPRGSSNAQAQPKAAAKTATVPDTAATPAKANSINTSKQQQPASNSAPDTTYTPAQLQQFEQAMEWLKPRSELDQKRQRQRSAAQARRTQRKSAGEQKAIAPGTRSSGFDLGNSAVSQKGTPSTSEQTRVDSANSLNASKRKSFDSGTDSGSNISLQKPAQSSQPMQRELTLQSATPAPLSEEPVKLGADSPDSLDKADAAQVQKDILKIDQKIDSITKASEAQHLLPENEPVAVAWHRERAEKGDAEEQYNLAVIYATGFGVEQDYKSAVWWYEQAVKKKHALAQFRLGMLYIIGLGTESSVIKGGSLIQDAARNGVSLARIINDKLLAKPVDGLDVKQAMKKVRETYLSKNEKQAGDQLLKIVARAEIQAETNRKAERFKGQVTGSAAKRGTVGNHIPSFLSDAKPQTEIIVGDPIARIRRHAKEGVVDAQFEYARMLDLGERIPRDRVAALRWYSEAAAKNNAGAIYYLAVAHMYGIGVPTDVIKGRRMLKQAAAMKHVLATKLLSYLGENKNEVLDANSSVALAWNLDLAMNENDPDAMAALGHIFNNGWGVKQNLEEGQAWLRKARTAGGKGAARELRRMKIEKILQSKKSPKSAKPVAEVAASEQADSANATKPVALASADTTSVAAAANQNVIPEVPGTARSLATSMPAQAVPLTSAKTSVNKTVANNTIGNNTIASNTITDSAITNNQVKPGITKGTLPANSSAARKAQSTRPASSAAQQARAARTVQPSSFWQRVKVRAQNLFRHDDDPFKPVFLVIMGGLIGLAVFKGMRNRDSRRYQQRNPQPSVEEVTSSAERGISPF